jgi:PTS system mannose-specific IID component
MSTSIAAAVQSATAPRVGTVTLARVFWRSLFLQASWNPRGMQNLGFAYAMAPALDVLYPDPKVRAQAALRHLEFFNCHPYAAAAIVGGAVRLEENVARGEARPEEVSTFKSALGPPFAALGDGFFWLALRPAAALAAAMAVPFIGAWALLVFLGIYNSVHLFVRVWLFREGYRRGEGVVDSVAQAQVPRGTGLMKAAGAVLAGAVAARSVLAAGVPGRPFHALFTASAVLLFALVLPRVGLLKAIYLALVAGVVLGAALP